MDGFGTTLRVICNSLAFFFLLVLSAYLFKYSILWGSLMILSALDQLEDVYFYTTGNRLIPTWFRPIDIILEGILALVGMLMVLLGLFYWYTFDSVFFFIWMVTSVFIVWSAVEDIVEGFGAISERAKGVTASVADVSKFRFFRRL